MTSPTNKINPFEDVTVRSKELDKKERKPPVRPFDEVIDQIDERRRTKEEEGFSEEKGEKKATKTAPAARTREPIDQDDKPLSLFDLARNSGPKVREKPITLKEEGTEIVEVPEEAAEDKPEMTSVSPVHEENASGQQLLFAGQSPLPLTDSTATTGKVVQEPKTDAGKRLQEIIDQIVDKVYTIKESDGKNEIVVELKGRFDGARLIIKEFDFAKKEMNITIDHLKTGADQDFLMAHRQELIDKLGKDHQIVVHIFTATTAEELPRFNIAAQEQKDFRREPREEKERRQRENEEETEEK
jgi:hypothetical protein